jgi:hypothetical protein
MRPRARRAGICAAALLLAGLPSVAAAAAADAARQSLRDAWWTGSLLAQSATTLPVGHVYMEPTLADNVPYARFDSEGKAHATLLENELSSALPVKFGVTDRLALGAILRFDYDWPLQGASSSGIGAGDPSLQLQYRLTQYQSGSWIPAVAVSVQETLPVGRYDRLDRQTDGLGSGAYTTTFATCFQSFFWMPNGRIVRARVDLFYATSRRVSVEGRSVYGTSDNFRGHVARGDSASADLAFEYSATQNWVLASDFWLERDASTRIMGMYSVPAGGTRNSFSVSGTGRELIVAPAVEYNWSSRLGLIIGVRATAVGRSETGFLTPVAAFSYFR